jgi:ADP-dependent NAD(P)H-hydrate dehydratase / NAD(P)H-hydrate epimerase
MQKYPLEIYQPTQIREIEQKAITELNLSETTLMFRAAQAALQVLRQKFSEARQLCIVCGSGNNGGDGYYLAKLAYDAGYDVEIYAIASTEPLVGAAKFAFDQAKSLGITILDFHEACETDADVIVDALLGIGLARPLTGIYLAAVHWINEQLLPTLAIDVPTGLCSETGAILGDAVIADATITFIGLKSGLMTGEALNYVGELFFDNLGLDELAYDDIMPYALRLDYHELKEFIYPRFRNAHKGDFGHVLIVGGDEGMGGAVCMAANAALRTGAGLVSVVTRPIHVPAILAFHPEIMVYNSDSVNWQPLLAKATVIVIGPGLGTSSWGEAMFLEVIKYHKPLLIDADGLYFLKKYAHKITAPMILTPHVAEAARLLDVTVENVQNNRFLALKNLNADYPTAACLLKGAGTLVLDDANIYGICTAGNAGMATAGMGDILSGVIASLCAQGHDRFFAVAMGVLLHAMAGDKVASLRGLRGIMATDLLPIIQELVNPYAENITY